MATEGLNSVETDYANDPLIAAAVQVANDAHNKVQQAEAHLAAQQLDKMSLSESTSPSRKRLSVISNTSNVVANTTPMSSKLPQRPGSVTSNASSASKNTTSTTSSKRASIVPRPTRASLLRQGAEAPPPTARAPNSTASKRMSVGPGVTLSFKERQPIEVKSTKAPSIAPRMTKAAALRSGEKPVSQTAFGSGVSSSAPSRHRRTESESAAAIPSYTPASGVHREPVKATKAPKIAPRMTKAAQLRGATGSTTSPKPRPSSMIVGGSKPPAGFI